MKQAPQEAAPAGGPDASILLATIYGGSSATAKALANAANGGTDGSGLLGNLATSTVNQIVVNTETNALAAFYGTSLSYWSRINLYAAAGYFQGVTGGLALASTDVVKTERDDRRGRQARRDGHDRGQRHECWRSDRARRREQAGRRAGRADDHRRLDRSLSRANSTSCSELESSQLIVDGTASLLGNLDVSLAEGFSSPRERRSISSGLATA